MLIPIIVAAALTVLALARGAWPLAVAAWALFGVAAIVDGGGASVAVLAGVICLILGGLSMTRGAIFDGSPKAKLSERRPSLYLGRSSEMESDSVHFTHRFWGP